MCRPKLARSSTSEDDKWSPVFAVTHNSTFQPQVLNEWEHILFSPLWRRHKKDKVVVFYTSCTKVQELFFFSLGVGETKKILIKGGKRNIKRVLSTLFIDTNMCVGSMSKNRTFCVYARLESFSANLFAGRLAMCARRIGHKVIYCFLLKFHFVQRLFLKRHKFFLLSLFLSHE